MRLREWRLTQKLTLAQAAEKFGIPYARTLQRYETGAVLPDAPIAVKAFELSGGSVTGDDLYRQRAEFLAGHEAVAAERDHSTISEAAE